MSAIPAWRPIFGFPTRPRTSNEYAQLAEKRQGFVVVGLPEGESILAPGERLTKFCQHNLHEVELLIVGFSTFAEWKAQAETLQVRDSNPDATSRRSRYYRCELVPVRKKS